ncbi:MAG: ATP-dependent helicase [Deltaproteobacteria bacterium]|nr:MAG: ATP-dependent helicase [Deltaproteobacteria bacterium]
MTAYLTPAQEEVVSFMGNTAIVAAAGSGKTFTIVEKIASLIQKGTSLDQFFIATFTKKAGEEIKRRLAKRLSLSDHQARQLKADTLHGLATDILREHNSELKLPENFQILEGSLSKIDLLKLIRTRLLDWAESGNPQAIQLIDRYDFHKSVKLLLDLMLSQNTKISFEYSDLLTKLTEEFLIKKRSQGFLDFQDLEIECLKLLDQPEFQKKLQQRFSWIIIDEFQDTSPIQWDIISKIWSLDNHLVIVGDPRQSIYRFRGANPHLFTEVTSLIEKRDGKIFYLNDNFRSGSKIIEFVNEISHQIFPTLPDMLYASSKEDDFVESHLMESGKIAETRSAETLWIAEKIRSLHEMGFQWKDIVLLFRTRKAIPIFTDVLKSQNIPYQTKDEKTLLELNEYIQVTFLLKKLLYPDDAFFEEAFRYTFINPILWNEIRNDFEKTQDLKEFLKIFFSKISESFLQKSQIYLQALHELFENLILLGSKSLKDLVDHLEILKDEKALIPSPVEESSEEAVQLMTVHASKGLEFEAVFLCDLAGRKTSSQRLYLKDEDGKIHLRDFDESESIGLQHKLAKSLAFEKCETQEKEEEIQESNRLLYVALTRAIRYLGMALPSS